MVTTADQKVKNTKIALGVIGGVFAVGAVVLLIYLANRDPTVGHHPTTPIKYAHGGGGGGGGGGGQHGVDGKHFLSKSDGWAPVATTHKKIKAEDGTDHFVEKHGSTALTQAKNACMAAENCHAVSEDRSDTPTKAHAWERMAEDGPPTFEAKPTSGVTLLADRDGPVSKGKEDHKVFFHNQGLAAHKAVGTVMHKYKGDDGLEEAKKACFSEYKVCQAVVGNGGKFSTVRDVTAFEAATGQTTYYNDILDHLVPVTDTDTDTGTGTE